MIHMEENRIPRNRSITEHKEEEQWEYEETSYHPHGRKQNTKEIVNFQNTKKKSEKILGKINRPVRIHVEENRIPKNCAIIEHK